MCGSSRALLAVLAALMWLPAVATSAAALENGRLELLAAEAIDVMGRPGQHAPVRDLLVLLAMPVAALLAAFLGTYLGIRGLSFGSLRHKDGWREVAYRFRSDEPLTVGKHAIRRVSGALDELEDLGKHLRSRTPTEEGRKRARDPVPVSRPATPARERRREVRREVQREVQREVTFARREEIPTARAASPGPTPRARPPDSGSSIAAGRPQAPEVLERHRDATAPLASARDAEGELDREARYRSAQTLLRKGLDLEVVRSRTGLKAAEIDLLRCVGSSFGDSA